MDWKNKVEKGLSQGFDSSKRILEKAKNRAKDIGDQGVLAVELKQLHGRHNESLVKLGSVVFDLFTRENVDSLTPDNAKIREILDEILDINERIAKKSASKSGQKD